MSSAALHALEKESDTADMREFSEDFQLSVIRNYLRDTRFFQKIRDAFNSEYFTEPYLQAIASVISWYVEWFHKIPSISDVREYVSHGDIDGLIKDHVFQALIRMEHIEISNETVENLAIPFFRKMEMIKALMRSAELMVKKEIDDRDYEEIFDIIKKARSSCSTEENFHDYIKDASFRYPNVEGEEYSSMVSTGLLELDALTQGGIDKGELAVVTAGTGVGKSHFLVHVGCSSMELKKKVWHVTLELSNKYVGRRYDSRLLGIPVNNLDVNRDAVLENIRNMRDKYLKIVEYPANKLTISRLATDYEKLSLVDFVPDVLVIDYPDLMLPFSGKIRSYTDQSMYNALGTIYASLRDFGKEYGIPIWGASQVNRKGVAEGGNIEDVSDMADSIKKGFYADLIVKLQRSKEWDYQHKARLFVSKNRRGSDGFGIPLCNVDLSTSYFEVDSHDFDLNVAPKIREECESNKTKRIEKLAEAMKRKNSVLVNYSEDIIRARNSLREYNEANSVSIRREFSNANFQQTNRENS